MGQPVPTPHRLYWLIGALFALAAATMIGQWMLG
jgi:hypothetical protein